MGQTNLKSPKVYFIQPPISFYSKILFVIKTDALMINKKLGKTKKCLQKFKKSVQELWIRFAARFMKWSD